MSYGESTGSEKIRVMVIASNSGGADHYVQVHRSKVMGLAGPAGSIYVTCSCVAGKNYWANLNRGIATQGCHAMKYARRGLEIGAPAPRSPSKWPFADFARGR